MSLTTGKNLDLLADGEYGEEHYDFLMRQWRGLDLLIQATVLSRSIGTPPSNPVDGDAYIVGANPTGAWVGRENMFARWTDKLVTPDWEFFRVRIGWTTWVFDEAQRYEYSATGWKLPTGSNVFVPPGVGAISRATQAKLQEMPLSPYDYGGVGDNSADDFAALVKLSDACRLSGRPANLRRGVWRIRGTGTLNFAGIATIMCEMQSPIVDARSGSTVSALQGVYAMTIGTPNVDWQQGRAQAPNIVGQLFLVAVSENPGENGRSRTRRGLFMKCSWPSGGAIHAQGYNGIGVKFDSVHDGIVPRIRVEECGNSTEYQLEFDSQGDTSNCLQIPSLQVEQSYDKIARLSLIRSVVQNLHMERTYIYTTNDGTATLPNATNYLNLSLTLSNSVISQAQIDAREAGTATPDGTAVTTTTKINARVFADGAEFGLFECPQLDMMVMGGDGSKFSTVNCDGWYQRGPSNNTRTDGIKCNLYSPEAGVTTVAPRNIGLFQPAYNAVLLNTYGGVIGKVDAPFQIRGDIKFFGSKISEVGATPPPVEGGRDAIRFIGCSSDLHTGVGGSYALFDGGYVNTAKPKNNVKVEYDRIRFGAFNPESGANYVTRDCSCDDGAVVAWNPPSNGIVWPSYTRTDRMGGYTTQPSQYIHRGSDHTWVGSRTSP